MQGRLLLHITRGVITTVGSEANRRGFSAGGDYLECVVSQAPRSSLDMNDAALLATVHGDSSIGLIITIPPAAPIVVPAVTTVLVLTTIQ